MHRTVRLKQSVDKHINYGQKEMLEWNDALNCKAAILLQLHKDWFLPLLSCWGYLVFPITPVCTIYWGCGIIIITCCLVQYERVVHCEQSLHSNFTSCVGTTYHTVYTPHIFQTATLLYIVYPLGIHTCSLIYD